MEETLTRVSSKAAEGIRFAWGLEGHLQNLIQSLTMIKAVLQDAARRPVTDDSLKFWLEMLQDVAYDADDVLDEFAYEVLRKGQQKGNEIQKLAATGFELGIISLQHVDLQHVHVDGYLEISWDRETDSFLYSSEVLIGREEDVSKVMKLLIGSIDQQQVLFVVSIVGMEGLGKITIAKKVYEEVEERNMFPGFVFLMISIKLRVCGEMLQKTDKTIGGLNNLDVVLENLTRELQNKTFLLVLDDVWNERYS